MRRDMHIVFWEGGEVGNWKATAVEMSLLAGLHQHAVLDEAFLPARLQLVTTASLEKVRHRIIEMPKFQPDPIIVQQAH